MRDPGVGIGAGLDIQIVNGFYLGTELRFLYWGFGKRASVPAGSDMVPKDLGHTVWPAIAGKFSYHFPIKSRATK